MLDYVVLLLSAVPEPLVELPLVEPTDLAEGHELVVPLAFVLVEPMYEELHLFRCFPLTCLPF